MGGGITFEAGAIQIVNPFFTDHSSVDTVTDRLFDGFMRRLRAAGVQLQSGAFS